MSPMNQDPSQRREFRSYDDLEQTQAHQQHAGGREFNYLDRAEAAGVSRREFMTLMGASLALAGLTSCRRPEQKIVPYVKQPEEVVPGKDLMYATSMAMGEDVLGLVVETQDGRPTKIEGNSMHPSSGGKTHAWAQAEILNLYDVHRSDSLVYHGAGGTGETDWPTFTETWQKLHAAFQKNGGDKLAILSGANVSPTMARLKAEYMARFPKAAWYSYEPISNESSHKALKGVLGRDLRPSYDIDRATVILSLDADFMQGEDASVKNTRGFAAGRRVLAGEDQAKAGFADQMNRLYAVEANFSVTGGMADHRRRLKASRIPAFARALVAALREKGKSLPELPGEVDTIDPESEFLNALVGDLVAAGQSAVIVPGRRQPPIVHAIAAACNAALGSRAVSYYAAGDATLPSTDSLSALTAAIGAGGVNTLIVLGGNPAYTAPADLKFADALAKVENSIHLGLHLDETAKACTWHLPMTHFLEEWGDLRTVEGITSVVQPMVQPLFEQREHATRVTSAIELVNFVTTGTERTGFDLVRETWKGLLPAAEFESAWRVVLHDGVMRGQMASPVELAISAGALSAFAAANAEPAISGTEIVLMADGAVYDGRYSFNSWLQETPDSITKLTWDNAALMNAATAKKLGVQVTTDKLGAPACDLVTITANGVTATLPVLAVPGIADDTVVLALGYGRAPVGELTETNGTNVYPLRSTAGLSLVGGSVAKAAGSFVLASTQDHHDMRAPAEKHPSTEDYAALPDAQKPKDAAGHDLTAAMAGKPKDRAMVRETSYEQYANPDTGSRTAYPVPAHFPAQEGKNGTEPFSLYQHPKREQYDSGIGYQWGMAIDLSTCTGCNACMVACQSENNIPVVGRERVRQGREMHWIRIDRYFTVDPAKGFSDESVGLAVQPVPCMHCENAPCEAVCPMTATVHDSEGLNVMIYNRCVGTRYCSNNCAYKVRRFNYFNFTKDTPQIQQMANNPDVTVRFRGVIEKCSYCLQRITQAKSKAKLDNRPVKDKDLQVACQQACPAGAIAFGNLNDPSSEVSRWKATDRNYALLEEMNTRPRTTYLVRLRNPHPALPEARVLRVKTAHHGPGHEGGHDDSSGHGGNNDDHGADSHGADHSSTDGEHEATTAPAAHQEH